MSFLVNGTNFWPAHYYRDDDLARSILAAGRKANPVLVTGLRRIGKSWFLRRFAQIFAAGATRHFAEDGTPSERPLDLDMPQSLVVLDGGSETLERDVAEVTGGKRDGQLLAIDELEKLVADPSRADLLQRILRWTPCPLVLVAAPVIFELASEHAPELRTFFEERCIQKVLRPLSRGERNALALQTCDPGAGVPPAKLAMATWYDWGGHPIVLQQVGALVRERRGAEYQALLESAHALLNLGAPRYGVSLAGDSGLTRAQRGVLARIAAREAPGDEHAAAVLAEHGAIVKRKSGWAVENCVLRRHLDSGGEPHRAPAPPPRVTSTPSRPVRVFSWIHLSDLHFGAGREERRLDRRAVTAAIADDLRGPNAPREADRVFVTGDIAFSAEEAQYKEAAAWLHDISAAAAIPLDRFRLVPGNHDVDRRLAGKPLMRAVHQSVRRGDVHLDDLLADDQGRALLEAKLARFQSFVEGFPGHPRDLGWVEEVPATHSGRGSIRVAGLTTVLVSDERDGNREDPFVPNLALGGRQLEPLLGKADGVLVLVLAHHPPTWLLPECAETLRRTLARLPHIHLSGHVHRAGAVSEKRFGQPGRSVRYVAGAAHGDVGEEYGYAWGAVRWDPASAGWQVGWAPRVYVQTRNEMRPDGTRYNLDAEGYSWEALECPWPAPSG
jgi:hypothetical protein